MRPSRWVLTIAIILVIPPVALVVFWFVLLGSSGSNEEAVSMVRGLSQQRLAQLFVDVRAMSRSQGLMPHFFIFKDGKIVPFSIADLHPRGLTLRDGKAIVYLYGCMDNKVSLRVSGLDSKRKGQVVLDPGEAKDPCAVD